MLRSDLRKLPVDVWDPSFSDLSEYSPALSSWILCSVTDFLRMCSKFSTWKVSFGEGGVIAENGKKCGDNSDTAGRNPEPLRDCDCEGVLLVLLGSDAGGVDTP